MAFLAALNPHIPGQILCALSSEGVAVTQRSQTKLSLFPGWASLVSPECLQGASPELRFQESFPEGLG